MRGIPTISALFLVAAIYAETNAWPSLSEDACAQAALRGVQESEPATPARALLGWWDLSQQAWQPSKSPCSSSEQFCSLPYGENVEALASVPAAPAGRTLQKLHIRLQI